MSLTVQREVLKAESVAARYGGKTLIDRELSLPESEPEPERVLAFLAEPVRVESAPEAGKVHITGLIGAEALCSAVRSDGQAKVLVARWSEAGGSAIPFESTVELPGVTPGDSAEVRVEIEKAFAKPGGGHSLDAHIELNVGVWVTRTSQHSVISEVSATPPVQLKVERLEFDTIEPAGARQSEWGLDEELNLPPSLPDAVRVLWWQVHVTDVDPQPETGAVKVLGQLSCEVLYETELTGEEEGSGTLYCGRWVEGGGNGVRFSKTVEWPGLSSGAQFQARVAVKGAGVEMLDGRRFRLQARLATFLHAATIRRMSVVNDCQIDSGGLLDLQRKPAEFTESIGSAATEYVIRETLVLPAGRPDFERLLMVAGRIAQIHGEAAEDKVLVEGRLDLNGFYLGEGGIEGEAGLPAVAEWAGEEGLPFEFAIDLPGCMAGADIDVRAAIRDIRFEMVGPAKMQVEIRLSGEALAKATRTFSAIANAAVVMAGGGSRRASMVFYVVQPGDTLWEIARHYNVTVNQILAANGLQEGDPARPSRKLLIPRA